MGKGYCFQHKVSGEKLQIPLDFVKKLFGHRSLELHGILLRSSLCREGTDIEEELCKRLHAVVTYIAGLLSLNPYSLSITQVTARESLRTFCVFWATTSGRLPSRRFLWGSCKGQVIMGNGKLRQLTQDQRFKADFQCQRGNLR